MKIRIKGNSVRFRLTKIEVSTFCKTGYFEECTQFPHGKLTYAVKAKSDIENLEASFEENMITLFVPKKESLGWDENDRVGFQNDSFSDESSSLSLLLEKDFTCLDNTIEDQSDNYPNPLDDKKC